MNRGRPCWRPAFRAAGLALLALAAGGCSPTKPTPQPELPTITCPADVAAVSNDGASVPATYVVPTPVGGAEPVFVACLPTPGSLFAPGSTAVRCTATDALARVATCGFAVKVSVPPRLRLTKFMAFGDSLTEGKQSSLGPLFKLWDFAGSYPTVMMSLMLARYTAQQPTMAKRGEGGERTAAGLVRLQGLLSTDRPEVLLLMEGANDLYGGDPTAVPTAAQNIEQMVVAAKGAGVVVFLATLPPQVAGGPRAGGAALVNTYNLLMKDIAPRRGAYLVDTHTPISENVSAYVGPDGLHLTTAGYQKLGETFFAALNPIEIPGNTPSSGPAAPLVNRIFEPDQVRRTVPGSAGTQHRRPVR